MENSVNQISSSQPGGPGGLGLSENTDVAGRMDTNSGDASYPTPLPFKTSPFNFSNSHYTSPAPASSGHNSFPHTNNSHNSIYSSRHNGQFAMPYPPADLQASMPGTPASRPTPRPLFARSHTDYHDYHVTPSQPSLNCRRPPPPNFQLPSTFGIMPRDDYPNYIPPPSPRTIDSESDNLPEPGDTQFSTKSHGKRHAKTPESADEDELPKAKSRRGKKHARKDNDEDPPKPSARKPSVSRASQVNGSKAKATAKLKVKAESKSGPKATKGRQAGSRNFSNEENLHLLDCINHRLPIGGAGWQAVANEYNSWATKHGYIERDSKSIKGKFDTLVRAAKDKPTGVANRDSKTNPLAIALAVDGAIEEKAGTLTLNDPEFAEAELNSEGEASEEEIIEITDDDDTNALKKAKLCGTAKDMVMTKAYRVAEPLADMQRRRPRHSAATEALSSLTNLFNPMAMRERDETRMSQSVHLTQLASCQQEVRELRARNDVLSDRLINETRRADRAESEVQLLRTLERSHRHRRHRRHTFHESDNSDNASPPLRLPQRRYPYPVRMASVRGYEDGPLRPAGIKLDPLRRAHLEIHADCGREEREHEEHEHEMTYTQADSLQETESITFFGHQPPRSPSHDRSPAPGPSVFPGSLDSLAAVAASMSESVEQDRDHHGKPTFSSVTLTPRRNRNGKFSFDVRPNP